MTQEKKYLISVIIPHLNQPEELQSCLDSLDAQTLGHGLFEVIVVDNGSDSLPAVSERLYPVSVHQESKPGPGAARNRGAAEASGEILAFIDADCRAHPDWLKNALSTLQSVPPRTVLGGDVQIWRHDPETYSALEAYESVFAYRFQLYIEKQGFSGTGNLVVKRDDFFEIGPFKGINFAEDIEWGRSVRAAGYTLRFVPGMIVYHPARKTLRELFVKWDRHIQHAVNREREQGQRKWRLYWIARAFALLASPAVDWIKVARSDRVCGVSARLKGIGALIAVRVYRFVRMMMVLPSSQDVVWNRSNSISGAGS